MDLRFKNINNVITLFYFLHFIGCICDYICSQLLRHLYRGLALISQSLPFLAANVIDQTRNPQYHAYLGTSHILFKVSHSPILLYQGYFEKLAMTTVQHKTFILHKLSIVSSQSVLLSLHLSMLMVHTGPCLRFYYMPTYIYATEYFPFILIQLHVHCTVLQAFHSIIYLLNVYQVLDGKLISFQTYRIQLIPAFKKVTGYFMTRGDTLDQINVNNTIQF